VGKSDCYTRCCPALGIILHIALPYLYHITAVLQDILVGLVRLRKVSGPDAERQPELRGRCSVVRELHVYGTAVAVHARDSSKFQHQVRGGVGRVGCGVVGWVGGGWWE